MMFDDRWQEEGNCARKVELKKKKEKKTTVVGKGGGNNSEREEMKYLCST